MADRMIQWFTHNDLFSFLMNQYQYWLIEWLIQWLTRNESMKLHKLIHYHVALLKNTEKKKKKEQLDSDNDSQFIWNNSVLKDSVLYMEYGYCLQQVSS